MKLNTMGNSPAATRTNVKLLALLLCVSLPMTFPFFPPLAAFFPCSCSSFLQFVLSRSLPCLCFVHLLPWLSCLGKRHKGWLGMPPFQLWMLLVAADAVRLLRFCSGSRQQHSCWTCAPVQSLWGEHVPLATPTAKSCFYRNQC